MELNFNATVAAQVFHFLLLLLLLRLFAYRPLFKILDERRRLVAESLEAAEGERENAQKLRQEQKEILAGARGQARDIIVRAENEARDQMREILAQARAAAEEVKARAIAEIEREREEVRAALRADLAGLVLSGTEKTIGRVLNDEEHLRLVRDAIGEVGRR